MSATARSLIRIDHLRDAGRAGGRSEESSISTIGEAQAAYPLGRLRRKPILNDVLGGEPVLILLDASGESGLAYSRRTEGKILTFEPADKGLFSLLRDKDTGSLWERSTGQAVEGPRKGSRLDPLVSLRAYWFAWRSFFPSSELRKEE